MKSESISKRLRVYIPLVLVIILVLVGAWYWYRDYSRYITTDDAHVDADNVSVSSKIIGRLSAVYANEGDFVKQGTLLAEIDSSDIHAQRNQALAMKAQAETNLSQSELKYRSDQKSLKVLEINLDLLDANTAVSESKHMLLKARIDYAVSVYRLKAAMGERLY